VHHVVHKLRGCVRSGANHGNFLTLLDSVKERLWHIQQIEIGGEDNVVVPNDVRRWLAIRIFQLCKDELNAHCWIPTKEVGIVQYFVFVPHLLV
jgi:hypothetical protein